MTINVQESMWSKDLQSSDMFPRSDSGVAGGIGLQEITVATLAEDKCWFIFLKPENRLSVVEAILYICKCFFVNRSVQNLDPFKSGLS